jgi:predicted RNA-binding protein YlqC (UPF0109 family)
MYRYMYKSPDGPESARRMQISEARGKLPELARYLVENPGAVVVVEHRDLDERIVMTTERHYRNLERMVGELGRPATAAFRLSGSASSALEDAALESALRELKSEQSRLAAEKLDRSGS